MIIFDLDGTLADIEHRLHFLQNKDWDSFYRACSGDAPIVPMRDVYRALHERGHSIEIWTGRSAAVRAETEHWLVRHRFPLPKTLLMRPEGDHCPDTELKRRWLKDTGEWPSMVFEDRASVVQMYRHHGIRVCQVAEGDF